MFYVSETEWRSIECSHCGVLKRRMLSISRRTSSLLCRSSPESVTDKTPLSYPSSLGWLDDSLVWFSDIQALCVAWFDAAKFYDLQKT